ncbi:hypothetical protein [Nocardia terpenica]|uniref:DUF8176 domain-containing protein n=1 Tax=Nocardia terpenica TaxID=455432 RepID=A0A6G9ZF67_9NOCA|nr:hypothetical protein [Nocardia terpenica]QIS23633.1 hypothetical protein F6W96_40565 [Nocardia terpenica]
MSIHPGEPRAPGARRTGDPALLPVGSPVDTPAGDGWSQWLDLTGDTAATPPGGGGDSEIAPAAPTVTDADRDLADLAVDARRRTLDSRQRRRVLRRLATIGAGVAAVGAVAAGVVLVLGRHERPPARLTAAAPSAVVSSSPMAPWCAEVNAPDRVVSSGAGDSTSAAGVIVFQQHAFYDLRDPDAVRSVLAPDAVAAAAETTRQAIAAIPAGTEHCVTVTPLDPGRWTVLVQERHPDGVQLSWQQVVTTAVREGRTLITAITATGAR